MNTMNLVARKEDLVVSVSFEINDEGFVHAFEYRDFIQRKPEDCEKYGFPKDFANLEHMVKHYLRDYEAVTLC